jgi:hypothetical protein
MQILSEIIDKQKDQLASLAGKVGTIERFYGSQLIWKIDNFTVNYNVSLFLIFSEFL